MIRDLRAGKGDDKGNGLDQGAGDPRYFFFCLLTLPMCLFSTPASLRALYKVFFCSFVCRVLVSMCYIPILVQGRALPMLPLLAMALAFRCGSCCVVVVETGPSLSSTRA